MADTASLIERLEKATSGDRLLDALIECEVRRFQAYAVGLNDKQRSHWKPVGTKGEVIDDQGLTRYYASTYSLSIDAAMTLVPQGLLVIYIHQIGDEWHVLLGGVEEKSFYHGVAASLPLALCIAALKARSQP